MSTPDCPMARQTAAWVLHALEPGEEAEVVRHLPYCPDCRALVAEVEATAAGLGFAVDQVAPPAGLRDRILDAAERTPRRGPSRTAGGSPVEHGPASPGSRRPGRHRAPAPHGGSGGRGRRIVLAFAAVATLSTAATYAAQTHVETPGAQHTGEAAARAVADAVASAGSGTVHAVLAPPGQSSARAVAAVLVNGSGRRVVTAGLPANDANRIYVLWGLTPTGAPQAVGTFDVVPGRPDPQPVGPAGGRRFTGYAISLEAGRSAPSAPSEVVASGAVRP